MAPVTHQRVDVSVRQAEDFDINLVKYPAREERNRTPALQRAANFNFSFRQRWEERWGNINGTSN
jgi:hypothetical protein